MNNEDKGESFQLSEGIMVDDLGGIFESYSVKHNPKGFSVITVNVSSPNIISVFLSLSKEVKNPGFLLLETGTHKDIESQLRKKDTDPFHRDVFYLDGLNWDEVEKIILEYKYLLSQDGGVNFGFGAHEGHDEVFVSAYKIFYIYADNPIKFEKVLTKLGFNKVDKVKTVWENFTPETPGRRNVLTDAKPSIWEMIESLKEQGLYLAERRED